VAFGVEKIFAHPFSTLIEPKLPVQPSDPSKKEDSVIVAHSSVYPLIDNNSIAKMMKTITDPDISIFEKPIEPVR
jgi:hypothetical protein